MKSEIEVKLRIGGAPADLESIRRRLHEAGATPVSDRHFEDNVLFDDRDGSLARRASLLRLRRCFVPGSGDLERPGAADSVPSEARLTWKDPGEAAPGRYKIRPEIEIAVQEPDSLQAILERLGLQARYRYQKYRTVFEAPTDAGSLEIMLDETPIGCFLELEGPPGAIDEFAARLGFTHADYITLSYRALQVQSAARDGREPGDMIFGGA
jgi:adenylate cyclase class 2